MKVTVKGIGLWSEHFDSWSSFAKQKANDEPNKLPKGEVIPAAERRRAPKTAKLAVEVAQQACDMASAELTDIASVFTSVMADTEITDQICRALAMPQKMMSPTKFHNSVQNAPGGYWAIGTGNHAPCNYVGGYMESWALACLEAIIQCTTENRDVLLVSYDIANKPPLADVCPITVPFASALVIRPGTCDGIQLEAELIQSATAVDTASSDNPSAAVMPLLEAIAAKQSAILNWNLNSETSLQLSL